MGLFRSPVSDDMNVSMFYTGSNYCLSMIIYPPTVLLLYLAFLDVTVKLLSLKWSGISSTSADTDTVGGPLA